MNNPWEIFSVISFGQGIVIAAAFVLLFVAGGWILARHDRRLGRPRKLGFHHYVFTLNVWEWFALIMNGAVFIALMVFAGSYM